MAKALVAGLRALFIVLCCVMVATLVYTVATDGLPLPGRRDVFTPWFVTTVIDFYINVVPIAVWISYKELNWISAAVWIVLLVLFGSITTCAYILFQLLKLTSEDASLDPMYHLLTRKSNKSVMEHRTGVSSVLNARVIFSVLGCLMLGTLLYTLFTDGSPFRKELLTPWMLALLIDFYINVVALSVWVIYKESLLGAVIWVILLICFGSISTCVYIVLQLSSLSSRDPLYLVLLNSVNRTESGYERT